LFNFTNLFFYKYDIAYIFVIIIKTINMKTTIKPTAVKKKSKYDNVYFDITINGHLFENVERSQVRHHISKF
jgi:hypothetical protein